MEGCAGAHPLKPFVHITTPRIARIIPTSPSVACEPGQVLLVDCKLARQELHQRGVLPVI